MVIDALEFRDKYGMEYPGWILPQHVREESARRLRHEVYAAPLWESQWISEVAIGAVFDEYRDQVHGERMISMLDIRRHARVGQKQCVDYLRGDFAFMNDFRNRIATDLEEGWLKFKCFNDAVHQYLKVEARIKPELRAPDVVNERQVDFTLFGTLHKLTSYEQWVDVYWAIRHEQSFLRFLVDETEYLWKGAPGASGYQAGYVYNHDPKRAAWLDAQKSIPAVLTDALGELVLRPKEYGWDEEGERYVERTREEWDAIRREAVERDGEQVIREREQAVEEADAEVFGRFVAEARERERRAKRKE